MAMLYPWATKEYLLWEMTVGQIVLYHNIGMEMKYGAPKGKTTASGFVEKSADELREIRDEVKSWAEPDREALKAKYGDIDG